MLTTHVQRCLQRELNLPCTVIDRGVLVESKAWAGYACHRDAGQR